MNPKPTRNAIFVKFSRENLAQFGLQKCLFRYGETRLLENRCFYEHGDMLDSNKLKTIVPRSDSTASPNFTP